MPFVQGIGLARSIGKCRAVRQVSVDVARINRHISAYGHPLDRLLQPIQTEPVSVYAAAGFGFLGHF